MPTIHDVCVLARWRWLKHWIDSLDADNKPMAYFVAFVCVCLILGCTFGLFREWYRFLIGASNLSNVAIVTVQLLLGIAFPSVILFEIASNLYR